MARRRTVALYVAAAAAAVAALTILAIIYATVRTTTAIAFDAIITPMLIESTCAGGVPFSFEPIPSADRLTYKADFQLGTTEPEFFCRLTIIVAEAGLLLDPGQYEHAKARVEREDKQHSGSEQLALSMFPPLGSRAVVSLAIGPGGGNDSVVFTTADNRYDVAVSHSTRLRDGLNIPDIYCLDVAREVNRRYEQTLGSE